MVWARDALPRKNTLTGADTRMVETAFALKHSAFSLSDAAERSGQALRGMPATKDVPPAAPPVAAEAAHAPAVAGQVPAAEPVRMLPKIDAREPARIDKSVLTIGTPKRFRDKEHLRFVAQQTCVLCGRKPSEAHHIRFVQPRALGRKASDEFAVPLCRSHHRAVHRAGDEKAWWQQAGIDPLKVALFRP